MKTAVLVIDVQKSLVDEGIWEAEAVIARLNALTAGARTEGLPVFLIRDVDVAPDGSFHPLLHQESGDIELEKIHSDAFEETLLDALLGSLNVDRLVVGGMQTEFCVDATCWSAATLGYEVVLVADAHTTLGNDPGQAEAKIAYLNNKYRDPKISGGRIAVEDAANITLEGRPTTLLVPGLGNSGPEHWHSHWERSHPAFLRVHQRDWERPVYQAWLETLENAIAEVGDRVVLVAHSLGCNLVAGLSASSRDLVRGALLVAPVDPDGADFPAEAEGFTSPPASPLPFPSIVVASSNDPYGSLAFARSAAAAWGSRIVELGEAGHLDSESGLGSWDEGFALLQELYS